ncbi:MAG: phosphate acyltransferase [Gemmatimonadota bacterium]|nr:phosphate acyltransferase [Gemmatimonadota bacterium]MDE2872262.1 phosphate acyltransferase [Gemmatimonadota bacterium]
MTFTERLAARARRLRRRIAFPEGDDPRVAKAVAVLGRREIVEPVVVRAGEEGTLARAVAMLAGGRVDGVVVGAVHTSAEVIRAGLDGVGLRPGVRTLSSSFFMEVNDFRGRGTEVLTFTDAGVVPEPGPRRLVEIAREAVRVRRLVVGDEPRVAFLSYSTLGSAGGRCVERVREAVRRFRAACPEVPADGELQADAALIPGVAAAKAPGSEAAGRANVLVFPSLDAGNIAYKLVERLAGATALGPILQGLSAPLNDLSRGASVADITHVAAITALMAGGDR